jgi:hypothetical protein
MFSNREMQAIKSLLIGDSGINISSLVEDLTVGCQTETNVDEMSVKVALQLSGKMPKFEPRIEYVKMYCKIHQVKVVGESSIMGVYTLRYGVNSWKKESDGTWVISEGQQSYTDKVSMNDVKFLSQEEASKMLGSLPEFKD